MGGPSEDFLNAQDILDPDLLMQLSDALDGDCCRLYVPARRNLLKAKRNRLLVQLKQEGWTAHDIANRMDISIRTVWRVLERWNERQEAMNAN